MRRRKQHKQRMKRRKADAKTAGKPVPRKAAAPKQKAEAPAAS